MRSSSFNESSRLPLFSYAPSPVHARSFLIMRRRDAMSDPMPVGDYMVLDRDEAMSLAEKKVMNLISALNGKNKLLQLGDETKSRQLFHLINDGSDGHKIKVVFYSHTGDAVSKENALLQLEEGDYVWN